MEMLLYRTMIIVGQLGRIWTMNYTRRKIYQSMTALGFFGLMTKVYSENDYEQVYSIGEQTGSNRFNSVENKLKPFKSK